MEAIDAAIAESARLLGLRAVLFCKDPVGSFCIVESRSICSTNFGPAKQTSTLLASAHESARSLLRSLQSVHVRQHNK